MMEVEVKHMCRDCNVATSRTGEYGLVYKQCPTCKRVYKVIRIASTDLCQIRKSNGTEFVVS